MYKFILIFLACFYNHSAFCKVAYIPLFDGTDKNSPINNSIVAINLESGNYLKKIVVGEGVGAIFINALGDKLYASAEDEYKIVLINTLTLEVESEWANLAVKPQQIILNKAEDKLYFSEYNQDEIYQLDLVTNQISVALTLSGFEKFWYSENLDYIVFKTHDTVLDTYLLQTYNLNQMSFMYQRNSGDSPYLFVSNDGIKYYLPYFSPARLYSLNLNNTDVNWYFHHAQPPPFDFFSDNFSSVHELTNGNLLVTGWHGTYEIDAETGIGDKISELINFNNPYNKIEENIFLKSTSPQIPLCPGVPPPGVDCYNYIPMQLTIQNHLTGTETLIYQRDRSGTLAKGRYIGNLFYSTAVIPVLNKPIHLLILLVLILFMAHRLNYTKE